MSFILGGGVVKHRWYRYQRIEATIHHVVLLALIFNLNANGTGHRQHGLIPRDFSTTANDMFNQLGSRESASVTGRDHEESRSHGPLVPGRRQLQRDLHQEKSSLRFSSSS